MYEGVRSVKRTSNFTRIGKNVPIQTLIALRRYLRFRYGGCTDVGDMDGRPWCSTLVDGAGNHQGGKNWGYCALDNHPECSDE